jgi:hypothetical protein
MRIAVPNLSTDLLVQRMFYRWRAVKLQRQVS